jgi:sulfur relay (sulfurtransferase) DsrF/TusC family protein
MKKTLQIVTSAYRCNVEEQDDPVLWISEVMKGAGADLNILLEGDAVSYAVQGQDASGLSFGDRSQTHAPRIEEDLKRIIGKDIEVYVVEDDFAERGLERTELVEGVKGVPRGALPALFAGYDQVWRW